jgi:hypothetical protein
MTPAVGQLSGQGEQDHQLTLEQVVLLQVNLVWLELSSSSDSCFNITRMKKITPATIFSS